MSGAQCLSLFSPKDSCPNCPNFYRQHDNSILYKQAGRGPIPVTLRRGNCLMELVHPPQNLPDCRILTRSAELYSRCTKQAFFPEARVGASPGSSLNHIPLLGISNSGPICDPHERQMPPRLFKGRNRSELQGRRLPKQLESSTAVCVPSHTSNLQIIRKDTDGQSHCNPDSSLLAKANVVSLPSSYVSASSIPSAQEARPPRPEQAAPVPSPDRSSGTDGMVPSWFQQTEMICSQEVKHILLHSRKLSRRSTYLHKWTRFSAWCASASLDPYSAPIHRILDYLMHLKSSSLSCASIRVHIAAITAFTPHCGGLLSFLSPDDATFHERLR